MLEEKSNKVQKSNFRFPRQPKKGEKEHTCGGDRSAPPMKTFNHFFVISLLQTRSSCSNVLYICSLKSRPCSHEGSPNWRRRRIAFEAAPKTPCEYDTHGTRLPVRTSVVAMVPLDSLSPKFSSLVRQRENFGNPGNKNRHVIKCHKGNEKITSGVML